ncbi:MAG TPA: carboxypeptidase-like regulatory domain-containing protein [Polyangiales bacterium]|jgi:hypothetical protein|nr:carboxypeptidase-like regulatory domain-containing protein [Polyangiales bacterium]
MRASFGVTWAVLMMVSSLAHAQPVEPQPSGHAAVGDNPHAGVEGAPDLDRKPIASAEANHDVPVGAIRVHVLDSAEHPVANAVVQIGTMSQESGRTTIDGKSNADGIALFASLPTGDKQAYRVNVLHDGAKYSSTPFRLPTDQGYDVTIRQLDTTHDDREVVLYVGATSVELKDERLKIVQQARLFNVGRKAYVFPEGGLLVPLPPGALAFQADDVMTDQHMKEEPGKGFKLQGSLPPGEVTLTWGFDLPREGSAADLSFKIPWPTFAYRVLADAADGMTLEVDGMPAPELHTDNGRRFFVTETMKNPGEQPLREVHLHLRGIPGPGPMRYIATALAFLLLVGGVWLARRSTAAGAASAVDFAEQKAALLARAETLEGEHRRGEVGPEFHRQGLDELEEALAALLYEEARASKAARAR